MPSAIGSPWQFVALAVFLASPYNGLMIISPVHLTPQNVFRRSNVVETSAPYEDAKEAFTDYTQTNNSNK